MTNITLSINDDIYKKMKAHSDIKWSEFVRLAIEKRINALDSIDDTSYMMRLSDDIIMKEWDNAVKK
ncbi:MAG: hypothetical protein HRU03_05980 [Nanoarchaeales archaeon]|nr:hypothetical protein [Nanoarchaeales archaeon]